MSPLFSTILSSWNSAHIKIWYKFSVKTWVGKFGRSPSFVHLVSLLLTILEVFKLDRWCKRLKLLTRPAPELTCGTILPPKSGILNLCFFLLLLFTEMLVALPALKLGNGWEVRSMHIRSCWRIVMCCHWHHAGHVCGVFGALFYPITEIALL